MVSKKTRDKRAKAIQTLRDTGMTDAEIEKALGHSISEEDEIIDAEVVSVEETPSQTQPIREASAAEPMDKPGGEECQDSLPARISGFSAATNPDERLGVKKWSDQWWALQSPETQARRCNGHKRTGERCGNFAIQGATVCRYHGGSTRHIKNAARVRLENAAERMASNLLRLGENAESETVQLSATNSALDRAGITKPTQVELGPIQPKPYEEIMFEGITTETREQSRARRGYNAYSPNYGNSAPVDQQSAGVSAGHQSHSDTSQQFGAAVPPGDPATEQEQDNKIQEPSSTSGNASYTSGYAAGLDPDAQSCNPPTQSETGTQPRPTSVGRNEAATTPAEHGGERPQEPEGNHQFPKGPTGLDGTGANTGQLVRQNPWQPSPDTEYTDPESGEPMTADEMVLYVARRMNEKAGTPPIAAELESPHKRYTAHRRRRSIY